MSVSFEKDDQGKVIRVVKKYVRNEKQVDESWYVRHIDYIKEQIIQLTKEKEALESEHVAFLEAE